MPADRPSQVEAVIAFALNEMIDEGQVQALQELLLQRATELLEVSKELLPPALERLAQVDRIHPDLIPLNSGKDAHKKHSVTESQSTYETPVMYLTPLYFGEKGVAERVKTLARSPSLSSTMNHSIFPTDALSDEQQVAINMALTHPVSILTGGPGTGKTTCLNALIDTLEVQHKKYALASATERAAKRLSEATGRPARTVHRLLKYSPVEGFKHNENNPLDLDFLVVDEASMLGVLLTNHLLKAVRAGTHVLFVGAGDVLRNLQRYCFGHQIEHYLSSSREFEDHHQCPPDQPRQVPNFLAGRW